MASALVARLAAVRREAEALASRATTAEVVEEAVGLLGSAVAVLKAIDRVLGSTTAGTQVSQSGRTKGKSAEAEELPKESPRSGGRPKSGWVQAATAKRRKPARLAGLRQEDWPGMAILTAAEMLGGDVPGGAVVLLRDADDVRRVSGVVDDLVALDARTRYVLLAHAPFEGAAECVLNLDDGKPHALFVRSFGAAEGVRSCGAVRCVPGQKTEVLRCTCVRRFVTGEMRDLLKGERAASAVAQMCRAAAKEAGVVVPASRVFDVQRDAENIWCSVRVRLSDVHAVLRASGRDGVFFRPLMQAGETAPPVVWMDYGAELSEALKVAAATQGTLGLAIAGKRLGVRVTEAGCAPRVQGALGESAAQAQQPLVWCKVTGALSHETAEDVKESCAQAGWRCEVKRSNFEQGRRVFVVASPANPDFVVLRRDGRPSLSLQPCEKVAGVQRKAVARFWGRFGRTCRLPEGAITPAEAAGDDLASGRMEEDHQHSWGSAEKAGVVFSCVTCGVKREPHRRCVRCDCGAARCAQCYNKRKAPSQSQ